jgi:hypothetical protein
MFSGSLAPVTNADDWIDSFELTDAETGDLIDISGATEIEINVRERKSLANVLSGSLTGGEITRPETGVFQVAFSADDMGALDAGTYDVIVRIVIDSISTPLIAKGSIEVMNG